LKAMYDSMPQYQFMTENEKKEFFQTRTDSYFSSLKIEEYIRRPSHEKKVTFTEHS
jgi:hypothetical protein